MKKLILKITIIIMLATILSLIVDYFYRHSYRLTYQFPKNILVRSEIIKKYELVKLGNSHSESGLMLDRYKVKSLNLSSVAQTFEYDLALLKMNRNQIKDNAVIIINVSPISFSQKKPDKDANVNMNYYDGRLSPFLIPHLKLSEYFQIQIVPFSRAGYLWRETIAKNINDKTMSTFAANWNKQKKTIKTENNIAPVLTTAVIIDSSRSALPTFNVVEIKEELKNPPVAPLALHEESMHFILNKWYKSGGFDTASFNTNKDDLIDLINYCLQNKWHPVLVTMPISQILQNNLEPGYFKKYIYDNLNDLSLKGIKYFNFSTNKQLTENKYLFSNSDHLNLRGASITSYLLLQELIKNGYLSKKADGYDYTLK
jgi:hypothetical protein